MSVTAYISERNASVALMN